MSSENVEIVRSAFNAFVGNDFEQFYALASEEIELYPRREEPGVRDRYKGWDEMLEYLVNWYSGWEDYTVEAEQFLEVGDYVVVEVREVGVAQQSGLRIEEKFAHALKVKDGVVVERRMYGPLQEALDGLGAG